MFVFGMFVVGGLAGVLSLMTSATGCATQETALAASQIGDHDGVVNLRLRDGQDLTDTLISHVPCVLTLFCGTWSTWAEGDVVDFEEVAQ